MRTWGVGVSCLGYSLPIAELMFVLYCVRFKTSVLFLFSLWQLFTDEAKAPGTGWDTSKQECGLLTPLEEGSHLPTLLWVVSEKETFIMFKPLDWIGRKVCSGFSVYCCSVPKSCQILWDPRDCSAPGFPVLHYLPEFAQTHVHWVSDVFQPSHPLSSPSPPAFSLSQHQALFQWVSSLYHVAKVLEFQLQHQPFQWIFRVDFL